MRLQDALHTLVPLVAGGQREAAALDLSAGVGSPLARERAHADAGAHRWRGLALYNVSRAVVRVAGSEHNREHFAAAAAPRPGVKKPVELHLALYALMGLRSQVVAEVAYSPRDQPLELADLAVPDQSLTIFGGQKPDIEALLRLRASGVERHFIAPAGERRQWRTAKVLDPRTGDALVEMRVPLGVRDELGLPPYVLARAIDYHRHGYPSQSFLTSLLEPGPWPRHELGAIHGERWTSLSGSRMVRAAARPMIEAQTPAEVLRRVGWLLSAYNLVRVALLEAARDIGQEPARMDVLRALEWLGPEPLARALESASPEPLTRLRERADEWLIADPGAPIGLSIEPLS